MILCQIIVYIAALLAPPTIKLFLVICLLAIGFASLVFMAMLAFKLYGVAVGILLCILTIIPCIGLLVLWRMSEKATRMLRDAGYHVGFLGARLSEFRNAS